MRKLEDVYESVYLNETLTTVTIEITSHCNWNCEHCYVSDRENDKFNLENLKRLFIQFRKLGVYEVVFIGGEMFVRKDIIDIIKMARSMFFKVVLDSNISLLDEENVNLLSELNVSEVRCTVFSLNEQIHDSITGIRGSLKKVLDNLKLLKKYNIKTLINTPVMKKNKYDFREVHKYCNENGFFHYAKADLVQKRNGESCEELILLGSDINEIISEVDLINGNSFNMRNLEEYPCISTRISIYIDSQGEVYPCVNYRQSIGNVFFENLDVIWSNEKRKEIANLKFKDLQDCIKCEYINKCVPCPGVSHMESNNIHKCSNGSLYLAKWRKGN